MSNAKTKTIKIHYLGFGVQTIPWANTLHDVMWHLGAKYGVQLYNAGVEAKAIVFIHEDAIVKVNVDVMNALEIEIGNP